VSERVDRDLTALAARNRKNQPPLSQTLRTLSGRRPERGWEERFMVWTGFLKKRPRLATLAATAVVAAALLVVPISYDKVVGHDVTLSLAGDGLNQNLVSGIAAEFKEALDSDMVNVNADQDDGNLLYTFSARATGSNAPAVSEAFARTLTGRGLVAEANSTPVKERVSSNVYAMALDNVVHISIDGKSAEELEAEIATQLEAAGLDAQVSVTMEGDDHMRIEVQATAEGDCQIHAGECPQIVLTSGGEPLGGEFEDVSCRMMIKETASGARQLMIEVDDNGNTVTATVDDPESLSDSELAVRVHQQFAAQGLDVSVSAQNGRVRLMSLEGTAEQDSNVKKTTWGQIKNKMKDSN
jgi:hypothetical protein